MQRVWSISFATVAAAMWMACAGNDHMSPSPTGPSPTPTTSVTAVAVTSANLSPTTIQWAATAKFADGKSQDVTSIAAWQSSNASIATISTTGLLTVVGDGSLDARAVYQSVTGSLRLNVSKTDPSARFALS